LTSWASRSTRGELSRQPGAARAALDAGLALAAERGVAAEGQIAAGDVAEEILRLAAARDADLVVVRRAVWAWSPARCPAGAGPVSFLSILGTGNP
jgi:nucleotide-binding universal stress UspA family protein